MNWVSGHCPHNIPNGQECRHCTIADLHNGFGMPYEQVLRNVEMLCLLEGWNPRRIEVVAPFRAVNAIYYALKGARIVESSAARRVIVPMLSGDFTVSVSESGAPAGLLTIKNLDSGETLASIATQ